MRAAPRPDDWTPADDARLTAGVAEGLSHAAIAARLGRTPLAVKTRLKRLRKPRPARPPAFVRKTSRFGNLLLPAAPSQPKPPRPRGGVVRAPDAPVGGVHLTALVAACHWPLWADGEAPTLFYCGAPLAEPGSSWCVFHKRICFPAAPARAREMEEVE